jgi:hypothetical protein
VQASYKPLPVLSLDQLCGTVWHATLLASEGHSTLLYSRVRHIQNLVGRLTGCLFVLEEEQGGCAILVKRNSSLNYTACLQRNLVANMRETKIYIREY